MFVPLHDDTPLKVIRFQHVTIFIIAINVLIYLMTGAFTSENALMAYASGFGLVPGELTGSVAPYMGYDPVPEPLTLITYQFLHAGWMHLISNMLFLWVFADNVEDAYGHVAFVMLYLLCGVIGGSGPCAVHARFAGTADRRFGSGVRHPRRLCGALPQGPGLDPALHAHSPPHRSGSGCWAAGSCCS